MPLPRFNLGQTALLVVDVQEKLLPMIRDGQGVQRQCVKLIRGCAALGVPVLATEQYPQGLGPTAEAIRQVLPAGTPAIAKMKFSACVDAVRKQLNQWSVGCVVVCGIESHVCVLHSALDLAEAGYIVGVAVDAIGSRTGGDHELGVQRMLQAGVVPLSVEMVLFELTHEAGTDRFKKLLPIVK